MLCDRIHRSPAASSSPCGPSRRSCDGSLPDTLHYCRSKKLLWITRMAVIFSVVHVQKEGSNSLLDSDSYAPLS